jgi:tetrahydromethanopterin S-methyltransferase subunit B
MTVTRIASARRLVIKVGSALVTNNGEGLDLVAINDWARQIAELQRTRQAGHAGLFRSHRLRPAAPWLAKAPERRARAAGGGCRRPDGPGAGL